MATKSYILSEISQGNNFCWYVCTQCMYSANVKIYDDTKTYFDGHKTTRSTSLQVMGQGWADLAGQQLKIDIDIPEASEIKQSLSSANISDTMGRKVGCVYDLCIEDSTDDDFNDIYLNIAAWSRKG